MISVSDALSKIVAPAIESVFREGEISEISIRFEPSHDGSSITLSLTAGDERFHDLVAPGGTPRTGDGNTIDDLRERLRSDMADFVAESRFGWGQNRGV